MSKIGQSVRPWVQRLGVMTERQEVPSGIDQNVLELIVIQIYFYKIVNQLCEWIVCYVICISLQQFLI